jgi:predicted methyltransferase
MTMTTPPPRSAPPRLSRSFLLTLAAAGLGAFLAGALFVPTRPARLVHPITGRVIAGTTTDAAWLDRPERQAEEAPDRALALMGLAPGMTVADVGAGSGYMTLRLAALVGPSGKVYANDIQPDMLAGIRAKADRQHLTNVETVRGSEDDARLPAGAVDLALMIDVYHELRQPQAMLRSVRRALKPSGRLVLIEYRKEDPRIPIAETHRMSLAEIRAEVEAEGFVLDRIDEALPRQHLVAFRRAP